MYNVTITTTGIFDEIRPSLFPLVEGKEGITFINALEYSTDDILPFEEGDDITDNGPEIEFCLLYTSRVLGLQGIINWARGRRSILSYMDKHLWRTQKIRAVCINVHLLRRTIVRFVHLIVIVVI